MLKLLHAFSPAMLANVEELKYVSFKVLTLREVQNLLDKGEIESYIGRENLAKKLSDMFDIDVEHRPGWVVLNPGDEAIVVQYFDPGPDSVKSDVIRFYFIEVLDADDIEMFDDDEEEYEEEDDDDDELEEEEDEGSDEVTEIIAGHKE